MSNDLYEFGPFRLDPGQRLLVRAEEQVRLPPMVFDLLLFLVQRSEQLVKKEEIIKHLWPDSFVEEGNLTNNISILRKELGDTGKNPKYIKTVPKHGYRFVANVKVLHAEKPDTARRKTRKFNVLLVASLFASVVVVVGLYFWVGGNSTKRYTPSTDAYQAYLRGRYFWNKRDAENLKKAIEQFNQAVALDNKYALAYAGLAECYNVLPSYGSLSPVEAYPRARDAATKALEIDNTIAEAHVALGRIKANYDWDWPGAEAEFKRAIELNSDYSNAHYFYALNYLVPMGKLDQAAAELHRALQLEPTSVIINTNLGVIFYYQGRYDQALAAYQARVLTAVVACMRDLAAEVDLPVEQLDEEVDADGPHQRVGIRIADEGLRFLRRQGAGGGHHRGGGAHARGQIPGVAVGAGHRVSPVRRSGYRSGYR